MPNSGNFIVGYALPPTKVETCITPSLISYALNHGIELISIDLEKPLIDQGPFHCLIHKIRTREWNTQLLDFKSRHPDTVIVDHPDSIEPLKSRNSMLQVVGRVGLKNLGVPTQVLVSGAAATEEDDNNDNDDSLMMGRLKLPLIAKPLFSDGSLSSHEMCLVLNPKGLKTVVSNPPVVLQQFVNHGGVVFKVYVAGRHVKCVKRKSVPDITAITGYGGDDGILPFSHISNVAGKEQKEYQGQGRGDELLFGGVDVARLVEEAEPPEMSFVTQVADGLRRALGLRLFNFDMIRDGGGGTGNTDDQRYLVIDINYFPGYAKVPGFEVMLTDFLLDIARAAESGEDDHQSDMK